ncbi:type II toxin-antitoxin system VapC family toxin [Leptolyngbya sp. PCC 6406]|uniref:type II toxin-antitoxin system VapC family toxin n=1 Tax=Leptolyngbya sp. PCC 6406 TaxID=1173264 RepID=UPI0002AD070B|nr:PIN domain-containing protein [Leptolyngbya sp. PCC 6406]
MPHNYEIRYIAATIITNIYYILRIAAGVVVAQDAITQVLADLNICAVDRDVLEQALALNFQDFEDAVQYVCAVVHNVDAIVTRDASGFVSAEIPVVLPDELDTIGSSE